MFKVLHITARADLGGGPEHLYQLMAHMPDWVDSYVACPDEPPYRGRYVELLDEGHVFDVPHRSFAPASLIELSASIRENDIDLLHSHGKGAGLYSRLLSLLTGRPCVHTFHGLHIAEYGPLQRFFYILYERLVGLWTSAGISVSAGEESLIRSSGIMSAKKLKLIENGVALPSSVKAARRGDFLQIVAVSRYDEQKNPELIIDIAEALKGIIPFKILVIGQGPRFQKCLKTISEKGLDEFIELIGPTTDPRSFYKAADAFLSTSRWEGMPMAVLEAMSEGLPVVLSDVVGNRDVIQDEITGYLYPLEIPRAAADRLSALLDVKLRNAIGNAARESVERLYSVDRMSFQTAELYESIMSESSIQR